MSLAVWRAFEGASKGSDVGKCENVCFILKSGGVKSLPMTASLILLMQLAPARDAITKKE